MSSKGQTSVHPHHRDVFLDALEKSPAERARFLDAACAGDAALRTEVEELLRESDQSGAFLESPALLAKIPATTLAITAEMASALEKVGDRIGRYKLLQEIGEGGCGIVYMAEQEEPVRRRVALKIIKLGMDTKSVIARFEAERQALAMMEHPNIAKVLDGGATETGRPYFVMELVRGVRITEYCDEHHLRTEERLKLFVQVCQAIQHAHQKGIIHRDIKPSNILVTLHDGVPVPKVIDFGIAKATEQRLTDKTLFTEFQSFIGTPAYMSPEQAEMSGLDIDTRSDVYSLGVLLYEMLTGLTPFDARELMKLGLDGVRRRIREEEPARPSTRVATMVSADLTATAERRQTEPPKLIHSLRGDLDWIVMKCLEKDRARRYATANDLSADVQRYLEGDTVLARPPSNVYRLQKFLRRHRGVMAAAAAIVFTLLAGIIISTWQAVRATRAERTAEAAQKLEAGLRQRAERQSAAARLNEYIADINLAQQSWAAENYGRAVQLLNKHRPAPGQPDLRGIEWRYLWQLTRGDKHETLPNQGEAVQSVAISPTGEFFAAGSDRKLRIWNARTKALVSSQERGATTLMFLPDGKGLIAAGGSNPRSPERRGPDRGPRSVRVLSTSDWLLKKSLAEAFEPIALSGDGRKLAAQNLEGVQAWNTETWQEAELVRGASGPIGLSWSGRLLAADSTDGIVVWNLENGRNVALENSTNLFVRNPTNVFMRFGPGFRKDRALAFSPDERWVVIAHNMPWQDRVFVLGVWDAQTGKETAAVPSDPENIQHTGGITSIAFSPDGKTLATASMDHSIRLWDFEKRQRIATLQGNLNEVWTIAFSPDGEYIVSGAKDGSVKIWPIRSEPKEEVLVGARLPISFSRNGRMLAALNRAGNVVFLDVASGRAEKEIQLEGTGFGFRANAAVSADLKTLASGTADGAIQLWNTETGESTKLTVGRGPVGTVGLSPDGRMLIAGGWRSFNWWDLRQRSDGPIEAEGDRILFSPDGRTLAIYGRGMNVVLWDVPSRSMRTNLLAESMPVATSSGVSAGFSPDGKLIALACQDDAIRMWSTDTAELVGTFTGHKQSVFTVAFSPDGRTLATGSEDSTLKFWNVATTQELLTIRRLGGALRGLTFSPDGRLLVAGTSSTLQTDRLRIFRAPALVETDAESVNGQ